MARTVFGDRLGQAEQYAELLTSAGVTRGLLGPREVPRLWERHLLNCAVLAEAVPEGATVADIGSGAGLPGLVLAIVRPDLRVTLVESLLRRTTFLSEVVATMELEGVEVMRERAEELHGARTFDVVTSRAVAPLPRLLEWSMPLVAATGVMLAMKGAAVAEEIPEAASTLRRLGCAAPDVIDLGSRILDPQARAVRVAWADPARVGWADGTREGRGSPGRSGHRSRGRR